MERYGGMRLKPNLFVGCDSNLMARQTALEKHNQALEDFSSCSCEPASSEHHIQKDLESPLALPSRIYLVRTLGLKFSLPFSLKSERESSNQSYQSAIQSASYLGVNAIALCRPTANYSISSSQTTFSLMFTKIHAI